MIRDALMEGMPRIRFFHSQIRWNISGNTLLGEIYKEILLYDIGTFEQLHQEETLQLPRYITLQLWPLQTNYVPG